jgi:hypothetical protein
MAKNKLNLPFTGITSFCRTPICENWSQLMVLHLPEVWITMRLRMYCVASLIVEK